MEKSFAVQCPPFNLKLSSWDRRKPPLYSKRILCFPLPNNTNEQNEHIAHLLLLALRSTVEELPFLAGSVVPLSKDQPWLLDLRPHGAAYLDVKNLSREISFANLRKARFSSSLLNVKQLCPLTEVFYVRDGPTDVCRLQANFVDGGLLLVVSIIHTVCDGRGISEVLKVFAEKFRKGQTGELTSSSTGHEESQDHIYSFDRTTVLSGNRLPGAIENHPGWTALPRTSRPSTKTIGKTFHISSDSLRALKLIASSLSYPSSGSATISGLHQLDGQKILTSAKGTSISTHDSIAALIWRSVMLARNRAGILTDRKITYFSQGVDCRTHCHLPEPYLGNAVYRNTTSLVLPHLALGTDSADTSWIPWLQAAARAIRAEISGVTAEKFRDLLGFLESNENEVLAPSTVFENDERMLLTSYFHFGMHELDFGEALGGKMEAFRLPSQGVALGVPVVLPRLPDGSCEFVMNETEEVAKFLSEDIVLRTFATECC